MDSIHLSRYDMNINSRSRSLKVRRQRALEHLTYPYMISVFFMWNILNVTAIICPGLVLLSLLLGSTTYIQERPPMVPKGGESKTKATK